MVSPGHCTRAERGMNPTPCKRIPRNSSKLLCLLSYSARHAEMRSAQPCSRRFQLSAHFCSLTRASCSRFFQITPLLICSHTYHSPPFTIMIASSSQPARAPFPQAKAPTARQIRKAEKLEKRASMHGSRHPGHLDGAIGKLTQVRSFLVIL